MKELRKRGYIANKERVGEYVIMVDKESSKLN